MLSRLGSGGMGDVYLATDTRLQRNVAVKRLINPERDSALVLKEARAIARLNHPNIAAVYDVIEADERWHIVMEYVEGETLAELLKKERLGLHLIVDVAQQIAMALEHAHTQGVIHCDLKPSNVYLTPTGQVKVLDFGLARRRKEASETTALEQGIAGTPAYMSPEQLLQKPLDTRTDIFSFGALLFELCTGERPFEGQSVVETVTAVLYSQTPSPRALNSEVTPPLEAIISRSLAKEREERYATFSEIRSDLRDCLNADAKVPAAPVTDATAARRVVAVLPFLNITGETVHDFLGVGIAEILISALGRVTNLNVLSIAATLPARKPDRNPMAVAKDLGVTFLIDGAVQKSQDLLRVTASIIKGDTGIVHWSGSLDGPLGGIFDIQTRLSSMVADALSVSPGAAPQAPLSRFPTHSVEAFMAYSKARVLLERIDVPGNIDRSAELLQSALALDPNFAMVHAALGEMHWARYRMTKDPHWVTHAMTSMMEALRLDPNQSEVRYAVASVLRGTGKLQEAAEELQTLLRQRPNSDEAHRLLGTILADQGRVEDAAASIGEAIRLRPNYWGNHFALGHVWYQAGRYKEAIACFKLVTEIQPDHPWGFQALGTAYHALGNLDQAARSYKRAMQLAPTASACANLGTIYYKQTKYEDAARAYEEAIRLEPKNPNYHRNLGDVFRKLGAADRARKTYQMALDLTRSRLQVNPNDAGDLSRLAVYEAKLGLSGDAMAHAARAVELKPTDVDVLFRKAVTETLSQHIPEALQSLDNALNHGFSLTLVLDDDDLAALRSRPEFTQLLESHRK